MGISLGKIMGTVAQTIFPGGQQVLGNVVSSYTGNSAIGAAVQNIANSYTEGSESDVWGDWGGIGTTGPVVPDVGPQPTWPSSVPATRTTGMVGAVGRFIPAAVAAAITKLSQRLGGAGGSMVGYGRKVWGTLSAWAAKNPGVSIISLLVSLGLTVEEAAHSIAWGTTQKRRRRARGISARDLRTTRRTTRKLLAATRTLRELCASVPHARRRRAA